MNTSGGNNYDDRSSFAEDDPSAAPQAWPRCKWPYIAPEQQRRIENKFFEDGATIHFDRLQVGGSRRFSWLSNSERHRVTTIVQQVMGTAHGTGRRLTREEVDAVSETSAHAVATYAWTEPVAIGAALAATANGRKTFKFPFYQPKATWFDPHVFPSRHLPHLRGFAATATWHVVRFLTYYPITLFASAMFFASVSTMMFGVGIQRDPRLTAVIRDTRAALRQRLEAKPLGASQPSSAQREANSSGSQYPPVPQPQSYPRSQPVDDSTFSAPKLPQWDTAQAPVHEPRGSTPAYPATNSNWDSDPFEDDASPISPAARRAEAAAREQSSGGASSWAKVRQQAQSASGASSSFAKGDSSGQERGWAQLRQDKATTTAEGPRGTEEFVYSKQDEEREARNYEKEQAQKEFDALLEAERRGESSTRGRR